MSNAGVLKKSFTMHYLLPKIEIAVQVFEGITSEEAGQRSPYQNALPMTHVTAFIKGPRNKNLLSLSQ